MIATFNIPFAGRFFNAFKKKLEACKDEASRKQYKILLCQEIAHHYDNFDDAIREVDQKLFQQQIAMIPLPLPKDQQNTIDYIVDAHINTIYKEKAKQAITERINVINPENRQYFLAKVLENVTATQDRDPELLPISSNLDLLAFEECLGKAVEQTLVFTAKSLRSQPVLLPLEDNLERGSDPDEYKPYLDERPDI